MPSPSARWVRIGPSVSGTPEPVKPSYWRPGNEKTLRAHCCLVATRTRATLGVMSDLIPVRQYMTALPETILPLVAIASGHASGEEIGIGAILGAPFMLTTLAMFVVGTLAAATGGVFLTIALTSSGSSSKENAFVAPYVGLGSAGVYGAF